MPNCVSGSLYSAIAYSIRRWAMSSNRSMPCFSLASVLVMRMTIWRNPLRHSLKLWVFRNAIKSCRASRLVSAHIGHADKVTACSEVPRPAVGLVLFHQMFEMSKRHGAQQLCIHSLTKSHSATSQKKVLVNRHRKLVFQIAGMTNRLAGVV